MRKFAFLLGLVVMTTSLAFAQSNYTAESDGTYTYTGTPVDELSIDFTTWAITDLQPSTFTDDMVATESHNMAFVKWKIQTRNCGDKGDVHALFNNNTGDAGVTIPNASSTNPPRVYLPTTSGSVGNITVYAGSANAWLKVFYKDDEHASWTQASSSIPTVSAFGERSLALNSKGQTSIYLEYPGSQYICITNLDLEIDAPEPSIYQKESDGTYTYTGTPVDELSIDFTTWAITDLQPSTFTDDMVATESHNMAFVKWKIQTRNCDDKGSVHALFNNNASDFGGSPANNATTNKPRIYLPTTATGVRNIKIFCGGGNENIVLRVRYKDTKHASWTYAGAIPVTAAYAEQSLALNSNGKTSIYLEYDQTAWIAITDITLETKYLLNTTTNLYEYQGEPVDEINVDFTSWFAGYLPSTLSDDMPLAEMNNLGFVKWKINNNSGYALFNNNAADFGGSPTNNQTTNPPTIYFPTTIRGVESVAITYTASAAFKMKGTFTDAIQTHTEDIEFPAASTEPNTVVWNLSSAGQTKVYFQYFNTVWPRIRSIVFTIKDTEATPLVLWAKTDSHGNTNRIVEANGEVRDVYLKRDFTADGNYYTLCLPFDLTSEQVTAAFGTCTLAKLTSSALNGGEIELNFDDVTAIEAGVPYLFLPAADIASCFFPAVTINAEASRVINTTYFKMTGIYNPTVLTSEDYFMNNDNYLVQVTDENPLKPFRAYFTVVENSGANNAPARVVFSHNQATAIGNINANAQVEKTIENGQIVIIKDGVRYNVLGTQIAK